MRCPLILNVVQSLVVATGCSDDASLRPVKDPFLSAESAENTLPLRQSHKRAVSKQQSCHVEVAKSESRAQSNPEFVAGREPRCSFMFLIIAWETSSSLAKIKGKTCSLESHKPRQTRPAWCEPNVAWSTNLKTENYAISRLSLVN